MRGKRAFDLCASGLGLLLLALPLALLALLIRLDSPGPALFRQVRVGRHGREFHITKFRTMHVNAALTGGPLTTAHDPRITRVGHWLRRRRLDELPQLWDVFRGAMSLVGPRPELPRYVAHYPPQLKAIVLSVRPGLTDAASLAFRHEDQQLQGQAQAEAIYLRQLLPAKLALQAESVQTATWRAELQVLWRTAAVLWERSP